MQEENDKDKINRGVLALTPDVAPYKVLPAPRTLHPTPYPTPQPPNPEL